MKNLEKQFAKQLSEAIRINLPGIELNLGQKYVIWQLINNYFFFNCSGTGTGKTIAALAVAKYLGLRMIVVTNNSGQNSYYEDAKLLGFDINDMLIFNYEKFSVKSCADRAIKQAIKFNADFLVFDEVHNVKVNECTKASDRSKTILKLVEVIKPKKFLIQTATPVINHVSETESLLKLGMNYESDGLSYTARKLKVYSELMPISIAFPKKMMKGGDIYNIVSYKKDENVRLFKSKPYYDRHNFESKFNAMKDLIVKGTIIYSEFTDGIVDNLKERVLQLGYTCGVYSGECKDGIDRIVNRKKVEDNFGNYDVMIITSAGSTGTNGLQKFFNRMIFFSLPPTWAGFEQALGRIDRSKSVFSEVEFYILLDEGQKIPFSDSSYWYKIRKKKIDSDLIRDGHIESTLNEQNRIKLKQESEKNIA